MPKIIQPPAAPRANPSHAENLDVVLIGSGVMSANLGALLRRLDPKLRIQVFEAADELAYESSNGWNNAGTGHAGICELSYTPNLEADGTVNVQKAVDIYQEFEASLQFWSQAVTSGMIESPKEFINAVPHISFVHGEDQVNYLQARYTAMSAHHFFAAMEYSADRSEISSWAPLLTEGRHPAVRMAATRMEGTDVNFGSVSRKLLVWLAKQNGCAVSVNHQVIGLKRFANGWEVTARETRSGRQRKVRAKFVFLGAGGGTLLLLQKAGLTEANGIGGFPIASNWLVCDNPEIVDKHRAKVYGQALPEAPTMAVPHLDLRILEGKPTLLFGPFAAWTTRFLHRTGRRTDLFRSVKTHNLMTLVKIGATNLPLIRYLVQQGTQSMAERMRVLRVFYPEAQRKDWQLTDGGIRVQAIKQTDGNAGIVHYGTEVLTSGDRTMAALLGASPGASVSVDIMMSVIHACFPHLVAGEVGRRRVQALIPTYGVDMRLPANAPRFRDLQLTARKVLQLV